VFEIYALKLGSSTMCFEKMFSEAYLNTTICLDATRHLANALWTSGLVILDADNQDLKRSFIPYAKELLQQTSLVLETTEN
jgi:hypothetical protein